MTLDAVILKHGALIDTLLEHGPTSRIELSRLTSARQPTITRWINELIEAGLVVEVGQEHDNNGMGRPRSLIDLNADAGYVVALHIGERQVKAGLVNLKGKVVYQEIFRSEAADPPFAAHVLEEAIKATRAVLSRRTWPGSLLGVGVSTAGIFDPGSGAIGIHSFTKGCVGLVPVRELLARNFGEPIEIDTDNWAIAIAERLFGSRFNNFILIIVDEGIGAAAVLNGRVFKGKGYAGEIGHLPVHIVPGVAQTAFVCPFCGQRSCLSCWVCTKNILAKIRQATGIGTLEEVLVAAADRKQPLVEAIFAETAEALASVCVPIVDMLHPDAVVLVGPIISEPDVVRRVQDYLQVHSFAASRGIKVMASELGADSELIGAAGLVFNKLLGADLELQAGRGWAHAVNKVKEVKRWA